MLPRLKKNELCFLKITCNILCVDLDLKGRFTKSMIIGMLDALLILNELFQNKVIYNYTTETMFLCFTFVGFFICIVLKIVIQIVFFMFALF